MSRLITATWRRSTLAREVRVLVDVDVLLDVLARRAPHYEHSAEVWAAVETGRIEGLIAAHTATTVHYLLTRHHDRQTASAGLADLLRVFGVAAVDGDVLHEALLLGWDDFEDAVQMAAAVAADATYLVTRNVADYRGGTVTVLQPGELAALLPPPTAADNELGG